ncbi:hypothetical protein ETB97_002556 [Aspergillus alliaceus]|uniref:Uncharacterized protein n=1 Tax=Petromyces alliaceus TaxID=209559 RepID=A0A8H6A2Y8_PETAA|nr:hypothetical protein ETB97_002556 [Aspergillus burnettii]
MSLFEAQPRLTKIYYSGTYDRIAKHHGFNGQGKVIHITGGASGVGFSISKAFAAAGVACITIVSRSAIPQEQAKAALEATHPSVRVVLFQASVTDSVQMTKILHELGPVDVLVLGAAVIHRREKATAITEQELRDAFGTSHHCLQPHKSLPRGAPSSLGSKDDHQHLLRRGAGAYHVPGWIWVQ